MNQDKIIIASILVALFTIAQVSSSPVQVNSGPNEIFMPPICEPGIIDDMPPHIRKVCMALENSNKLSFALNQYIKNEASAIMYRGEDLANSAGKRTDVDHVFLRFGRR